MTVDSSYVVGFDCGISGAMSLVKRTISSNTVEVIEVLPLPLIEIETKTKVKKSSITTDVKRKFKVKTRLDSLAIKEILNNWNVKYKIDSCVVEEQSVRHGQGLVSSGTTMESYGLIVGMLVGMGLKYIIVAPKAWQKLYPTIDIPDWIKALNKDDIKKKSIALATLLFPETSLLVTKRSKVPHDAFSDSILIANYFFLNN